MYVYIFINIRCTYVWCVCGGVFVGGCMYDLQYGNLGQNDQYSFVDNINVVCRATEILKSKSVRSTDDVIDVIRTCI